MSQDDIIVCGVQPTTTAVLMDIFNRSLQEQTIYHEPHTDEHGMDVAPVDYGDPSNNTSADVHSVFGPNPAPPRVVFHVSDDSEGESANTATRIRRLFDALVSPLETLTWYLRTPDERRHHNKLRLLEHYHNVLPAYHNTKDHNPQANTCELEDLSSIEHQREHLVAMQSMGATASSDEVETWKRGIRNVEQAHGQKQYADHLIRHYQCTVILLVVIVVILIVVLLLYIFTI
jgi:hypothetical protein